MKVAFVSTMEGLPWGGSEILWSRTAARLLERGHAVASSTRRWPSPPAHLAELQRLGCQTYFRTVPPPLPARLLRRFGFGRHAAYRWLRRIAPDLVVISLGIHLEGADVAAACREFGLPYALVVQSADEHRWPGDDFLRPLRAAYTGARACFFISHANRRIVEDQLATQLHNARFVRNPSNVRPDVQLPWPDDRDGLRLACVGTMAPVQKAQDLVIRLLSASPWRDRPVSVTFYGAGQNDDSVRRLARLCKLERAAFGGFTPDVEGIWAAHHALVLPSRHEGMPIVTVEAMLCGRVCIVTDVGSNAELIDDGVTGFLAKAATLPLLDQAMERAWERRGDWPVIGAAAARSVRERIPADPVDSFVGELEQCVRGAS
jgi:glycosyltransferase involved in cell wall biosynthesis